MNWSSSIMRIAFLASAIAFVVGACTTVGEVRSCNAAAGKDHERSACHAVGVVTCGGEATGGAFLVQTEGRKEIIVTSAAALVAADSGEVREQCRFHAQRFGRGVPLEKAVTVSAGPSASPDHEGLAIAQVASLPQGPNWTLDLISLGFDDLAAEARRNGSEFAFLGPEPSLLDKAVHGLGCVPSFEKAGQQSLNWRTRRGDSCPPIDVLAGSPGMMFAPADGRYEVFCVKSDGRLHPIPEETAMLNGAVSCILITAELIALIDRLSKDQVSDASDGGLYIDFARQADELGYP